MQKSTRRFHRVLILEGTDVDAELLQGRPRETGLNLKLRRGISKATYLDELDGFASDLTIADRKLPDLDGYSAFNPAKEKDPYLPFIIMSGFVDDSFASRMKARNEIKRT